MIRGAYMGFPVLVTAVMFYFSGLQPCQCSGHIEINMERYQSSCSDNFGTTQCDTYFYLCIDRPGDVNINSCDYQRYGPSSHYENTNSMEFGSHVGGISNPMIVTTTSFENSGLMFVVQSIDKETWQSDEHLVTMGKTVYYVPAADKASADWEHAYMHQGSYHVWFSYRSYCDAYYYTSSCDVYCRAQDDDQGHYTCIPLTGQKKCIRGWTGEHCNIDIDECALGPCYHNAACTNLPGSYQCDCPNGYTGLNCDLIDSQCHSNPCQNGGTCTGTMEYYNCTCPFEWEGIDCDTQVDFCESNPCQNNATCYGSVGNYTCDCGMGWDGDHCEIEVNACDSGPCQNNASCTNITGGLYECTCPDEFEGNDCQTLKDPCDPNPCENSGTCEQLTYDTFNCTCVYGWDGFNCSSYINVTSGTQEQHSEKEGVIWVAIVIAVSAALVIIACILILFFIRRRKQRKALEARMADMEIRGNVVEVARNDNIAFRNALYEESNRANSAIENTNRPPLPAPPESTACKLPDDFLAAPPVCVSTKAKQFEEEEQGAVGGTNPYHDINEYTEPVKDWKKKMVDSSALDTRTMAGSAGGPAYANGDGTNHYADFEDLKRRSVATREASAAVTHTELNAAIPEQTDKEEIHYHDLDEVCLSMQNETNPSAASEATAAASASAYTTADPPSSPVSHYDTPPSSCHYDTPRSSSATEFAPPANLLGAGYMAMSGPDPSQGNEPQDVDTEEEDEEEIDQDIAQLRREALQKSVFS